MLENGNNEHMDAYSLAFDLSTTGLNVEGGYYLIDLVHCFEKKDEAAEQKKQVVYPRATIDKITQKYISPLQLKHVLIHRGGLDELMTSNGLTRDAAVSLISDEGVKLVILDQYGIPYHDIKFNEEIRAMLDKTPPRNPGSHGRRGRGGKGWIN